MALNSLRLRRVLSVSSCLLRHSLHQPKPFASPSTHTLPPAAATVLSQLSRPFTSTTTLYLSSRKPFNPETDEIGPDTILFEGCDYNHWLITIDFPKDSNITREQMIETYVNTAAQIFGSVEEAKKKIYALSTTTYQGFQVECSEETSEKFKGLPGVVFVLPDSYIDPVNKEYGGDKYVNGEIFPRPPPVHYGRHNSNRDRRPREQRPYQHGNTGYNNQGPPPQQNYGPPRQQNYGPPPPQQNYGPPPPPQNYGPPPPQQNYGPPPPHQNYGPPPPRQNYGPPPQQNYGPPPQQNYGPPQQQNYGNSPNFTPQQNYGPPRTGERRGPMPPQQGNPSHPSPEQRDFAQDSNYGSPQGGGFGQVPGGQRSFSSMGNN